MDCSALKTRETPDAEWPCRLIASAQQPNQSEGTPMTVLHTRTRKPVACVAAAATATEFPRPASAVRQDPFRGPVGGVSPSKKAVLPRTLAKGNSMLRRGFVASASVSMLGAALLGGAATARADTISLDNGLSVDTGVERPDGSRQIIVSGIANTDDHINVRTPDGNQFERSPGSGGVASFIVNRNQPEVALQPCARGGFYGSSCGKWSTFYPYKGSPPPVPGQQSSHQHIPPPNCNGPLPDVACSQLPNRGQNPGNPAPAT